MGVGFCSLYRLLRAFRQLHVRVHVVVEPDSILCVCAVVFAMRTTRFITESRIRWKNVRNKSEEVFCSNPDDCLSVVAL